MDYSTLKQSIAKIVDAAKERRNKIVNFVITIGAILIIIGSVMLATYDSNRKPAQKESSSITIVETIIEPMVVKLRKDEKFMSLNFAHPSVFYVTVIDTVTKEIYSRRYGNIQYAEQINFESYGK